MTYLLLPFRSQIHTAVAPFIYLVLVVSVALAWGMGAAIVASLAGALAFDYYFLPPLDAFGLSPENRSALLAFIIASVTVSMISVRARRIAVEKEAAQMEKLQQQAGELREQAQLLDLAHDAIMVRGLDGRIIFWNQGAAERYGWSKQEAIGRIAHDLLQTEFPQPLEEIMAEASARELLGGRA